jgi:hypothetical protein
MRSRGLGLLAALLTAVAVTTYAHGVWVGRFLELRATNEYCDDRPLAFPATDWSWVPLRHHCRWADGSRTDLVPAYVNPLVGVALLGALICVVCAIRIAGRRSPSAVNAGDAPSGSQGAGSHD